MTIDSTMPEQLTFEERYARIGTLADDPNARVMVFIDGQNLYKRCYEYFGHALCHPHLLARYLAGSRSPSLVAVRFYTGVPDRNVDEIEARKYKNLHRRLLTMERHGVTAIRRPLRYHWAWGPAHDQRKKLGRPGPDSGTLEVWTEAYQRPQEKGIDLAIGLDVIEFAVTGSYDVAIVVSRDSDLHEIPKNLKNLQKHLPRPVRIEAAVLVPDSQRGVITLPDFHFTHQVDRAMFELAKDETNYNSEPWEYPVFTVGS